jgi:hypothetical protein
MTSAHRWLLALGLAIAGCADGTSTLALTVDSSTALAAVDHVQLTFVNVARNRTSSAVTIPWGGAALPPARTLSFSFPAAVKGTVHVRGTAFDGSGSTLATGDADVAVSPSHSSSGAFVFGVHVGGPVPDAGQSKVTVDRSTGVSADGADSALVTVTLKDASGAALSGVTVLLSASGTGGVFSTPNPTDANGITTSRFTSTVAETKTITAVANGVTLSQTPTVTFAPASAVSTLVFTRQPSDGFTTLPLPSFKVAVQDGQGRTITTANNPITIALQTNPGGATVLGYTTATAVNGEATFSVLGLDKAASGYKLAASSGSLAASTSAAFNVTPVPFRVVQAGYGGPVYALALGPAGAGQPQTLYAGTTIGVFKSANGAGTWAKSSFGLDAPAWQLAVDPTTPTNVYAAPSLASGSLGNITYFVRKSTNAGAAWQDTGQTTQAQVGALAIDPMNPSVLYAGNPTGLFKTSTGGATWTKTAFPYACYDISVDPITPSNIYAYAYDQTNFVAKGVYKSPDGGATWAPVNTGLTSLHINWIVAAPTAVFAGAGVSVFRSVDGGANWTNLATPNGSTLTWAPSNPTIVYLGEVAAGVAASSNGGVSFGTAVNVGGTVNALVVDPANANQVWAGTSNGVFSSINGGSTWTASSIGITVQPMQAVAMSPGVPGTVLASSGSTIYRTTDGGVTWSSRTVSDTVWALQFDPATATKAYACSLGGNFYVSTDSGNTWSTAVATGGSPYCYNIDVHGSTIYVSTVGGVRKSTTSGVSWAATGLTAPSYAVVADSTTNTVVAGTNAGIQRSTNGGSTWAIITTDLASGLIVDPLTPTAIDAGLECGGGSGASSNGGFRKSTDFGATWGAAVPGACIGRMFTNGSYLYASARGGAAFALSTDQGMTWNYGGAGIPQTLDGNAIVASADKQTLYVATTAGLYVSTTGGF